MKHRFTDLLDFLFPRYCRVCGARLTRSEQELCVACLRNLPRTDYHRQRDNRMEKLFWGTLPIERAAALFYYRKESRYSLLLYHLKYYGHPQTGYRLACIAAAEFAESRFFEGIDCIVPLPLSRKKERSRGYNQSEVIARGLSDSLGLPIEPNCLVRTRSNETQTHKGRAERWDNVQGIFAVKEGHRLHGRHLLLVDDVVTTGATLSVAAQALLTAAPTAKISFFTLAASVKEIE